LKDRTKERKTGRSLYDYPDYYEIAFSFRNIAQEAEVFDECIRRYSTIPVRTVLELGSGTAPHMEEWAKRGIAYVGIDTNENMIDYAKRRARDLACSRIFLNADMRNFHLDRAVDFAYTMLGSLYVETVDDIDSHFSSVAEALNPGGLYLLDWCVNFQWADPISTVHSWRIEKGLVKIDLSFRTEPVDRANQTIRNVLVASIDDNGKNLELESRDIVTTIFPREFKLLVEKSRKFELIGWWNHWNLEEPVEKANRISRPIILLRRT